MKSVQMGTPSVGMQEELTQIIMQTSAQKMKRRRSSGKKEKGRIIANAAILVPHFR